MTFKEYLASFITPQMTLLEKFNALCKFIEEKEQSFYYHRIAILSEGVGYYINFIDTKNKQYSIQELNQTGFFGDKLNLRNSTLVIVNTNYAGYNILNYIDTNGQFKSIRLQNAVINSQDVSLYEN